MYGVPYSPADINYQLKYFFFQSGTEYVKEESDTENIQEEEEKVITPLKEETDPKKEEKKRPSFLMQWAKKGVDNKPQLKEKDTNIIVINDSPQKNDEAIPANVNDVKKELNLAKPIAVRRKPKDDSQYNTTAKPIAVRKTPQEAKPIEIRKKLDSTNQNATKIEAKPIEVRKKPRVESTNQITTKSTDTVKETKTLVEAKPIAVRKNPRNSTASVETTNQTPKKSIDLDVKEIENSPKPSDTNATTVEVIKKIKETDINSPSTSKSSPKPIAVKRRSNLDTSSPKTICKKTEVNSPSTNESPSTKTTVRKKPNQMNITKFFTSPSEPPTKKKAVENKSRVSLFSKESTENKDILSEDNVAQDSWKCEKMEKEKFDDCILIEDSQDIKLILEDSQKECSLEAFEKFEKLQCDKEIYETNENEITKDEKTSEENIETHHTNSESLEKNLEVPQVNDIKNQISDLNLLSPIRKKKVPFITLSSPKNKKKLSDTS